MGLTFTSCEKEENSPISSNNIEMSSSKGSLASNNKSGESEMEALAKAANVQEISYSNGVYSVYFYNSSITYNVTINTFNTGGVIDFDIEKSTGGISNITIDSTTQTIAIEGVASYSFVDFAEFEITPTNDPVFNLASVITAFHFNSPNTSASFDYNGDNDVFPGEGGGDRFWGWDQGVVGPCVDHVRAVTYTYYIFGIGISSHDHNNLC